MYSGATGVKSDIGMSATDQVYGLWSKKSGNDLSKGVYHGTIVGSTEVQGNLMILDLDFERRDGVPKRLAIDPQAASVFRQLDSSVDRITAYVENGHIRAYGVRAPLKVELDSE